MSDRINTFSESAMKQIAREVFRGERQSIVSLIGDHIGKHGSSRRTGPMNQTPVQIANSTAEEIPPYGVCRVIDTEIRGGWEWVQVAKPDGSTGLHVVNGPVKIAANGTGFGTWLSEGGRVAYDTEMDTPAVNDELGPVADSWLAGSGGGIKVVGPVKDGVVHGVSRNSFPENSVVYTNAESAKYGFPSLTALSLKYDAGYSDYKKVYSRYQGCYGDEATVGIAHNYAEASPDATGNFTATKSGFYCFEFDFKIIVNDPMSSTTRSTQDTSTAGSPSHYHTYEDWTNAFDSHGLKCGFAYKPYGGSITLYSNAIATIKLLRQQNTRQTLRHFTNLDAGDELSFYYEVYTYNEDDLTVELGSYNQSPHTLEITRIGEQRTYMDFT